jgi:hypothetical protein
MRYPRAGGVQVARAEVCELVCRLRIPAVGRLAHIAAVHPHQERLDVIEQRELEVALLGLFGEILPGGSRQSWMGSGAA